MAIIKSIFWEQERPDELIHKFPFNNITTQSVVTVNESQEAYFFNSGVLCDSFKAGRHVLTTANIPILQKFLNIPSGGETTFTAEIWFISTLHKRNMFWGTGNIRIIDPYFEIPVKLGARGQYGIRIANGGVFLKKFIGTQTYADTDMVEDQFRIDVIESVRVTISRYLKENNLNINEVNSEYRKISQSVYADLQSVFDEYGVELLNFNIEDITIDETDPGYKKVLEAIAQSTSLKKLGTNYIQDRQMDIAQSAAANEGAGNAMGIGMGLGVGASLGNVVTENIQAMSPAAIPPPPGNLYYISVNGQATGPYDLASIQNMVSDGKVNAQTYVLKKGTQTWKRAMEDVEVAPLLEQLPPPPPDAI